MELERKEKAFAASYNYSSFAIAFGLLKSIRIQDSLAHSGLITSCSHLDGLEMIAVGISIALSVTDTENYGASKGFPMIPSFPCSDSVSAISL